jgi:catechol 2,3-dioxygenase-like lactoylglutathione lyase family enzyme
MARVVGIDHLVISVGDFEKSKAFYKKVLGFLGFKLKHEYGDMAGWSNSKTLFWIAQADAEGRRHPHRKGNIGFHHYAFELSKRADVDELYGALKKFGVTVTDPPDDYYEGGYYAVYFLDPDGMRFEGMVFDPKGLRAAKAKEKAAAKKTVRKKAAKRKKPSSSS